MYYLTGVVNEAVRLCNDKRIGVMLQPKTAYEAEADSFFATAADNGCFSSQPFDAELWQQWLPLVPTHNCKFAVLPDVVANAVATLERSLSFLTTLQATSLPIAFVTQDGCDSSLVPWSDIDAIFTGGSDQWKESEQAYNLVNEAKRRGLWTHMGRVNGKRRTYLAALMGYDSVDGTYLRFCPYGLPHIIDWLDEAADVLQCEGQEPMSYQTIQERKGAMPTAQRFTGEINLEPVGEAAVKKDSGVDLTPYKERLTQSWNKKSAGNAAPGFVFNVPNEAVASLKSRFRQAARELGLGVAFGDRAIDNANTAVTVEARKKKEMPARSTNGAAPAQTTGLPKPSGKGGK